MDRLTYFERWSALHGGVDPRSSRLIAGWLGLVHLLARPLVALRVAPDLVTLLGVLVAALVPVLVGWGRWGPALAGLVCASSALVDSLDGAVAVMTGRVTRWGFVLDSVADRFADGLFLLALWLAGAPSGACVAALFLALVQEYARARAAAGGLADVGVLTVNERPTRVIVTTAFLLATAVRPGDHPNWATLGAYALVVTGGLGLTQILIVARRRLAVG